MPSQAPAMRAGRFDVCGPSLRPTGIAMGTASPNGGSLLIGKKQKSSTIKEEPLFTQGSR